MAGEDGSHTHARTEFRITFLGILETSKSGSLTETKSSSSLGTVSSADFLGRYGGR